MIKKILFALNGYVHGIFLGGAGFPCKISPFANFKGIVSHIKIGSNSRIYEKAYLHCDSSSTIRIGSRCEIHPYARLMTYGGSITIGDSCSVNPYSLLYGHGGLEIGSMVRIAAHVVIIPASHGIERTDIPIFQQEMILKKIIIKDNVWIGAGAKILGGVTINSGAVIGANAVVTREVPENAVVAGVPAKIIRFRRPDQQNTMDET